MKRLRDDWFVGVDTLERAERILASITVVYRDFGLEINGNKTTVDRVIALSKDQWIPELSGFYHIGQVRLVGDGLEHDAA